MEGAPVNDRRRYGDGGPQDGGRGPYGQDPYGQEQQQYGQEQYGYDPYGTNGQDYDPYGEQGYDYQQGPGQGQGHGHGQGQPPGQGYGYDPYGRPYQQQAPQPQHGYAPQAPAPQQAPPAYDPYGPAADTGEQWSTQQMPQVPQQRPAPGPGPGQHQQREYHTEQFSFIEDEPEQAEDVIDWLKFTESRTERREEAKRKGRNRRTMLVVTLVFALIGCTGYLWWADKLPFVSGGTQNAAAAGDKRDVIVVHLRNTKGGGSSTALLVDNATTKKATTVLLPNSVALSTDDGGATTLGKSVEAEGAGATRDGIDRLLGSDTKGTWRLDTPYLELLVESLGGIQVNADTTVPATKKGDQPLVTKGAGQDLNGRAAVAYATYRAKGEPESKQLARFGAVMQGVLKKTPSDTSGAQEIVKTLGQIPDPSLTEGQLAASLAALAENAKSGAYDTKLLPVQRDGTLSAAQTESVVKDVLGGTVKNAEQAAEPRVSVQNATGSKALAEKAKIALVNGGFSYSGASTASAAQPATRITYGDDKQAEAAKEVARTLGLTDRAVKKGKTPASADIAVVLGQDFKG
ncbi:LCP family protein [Streptomyces sp. A7024]|uniref:LCP family protein n=1 Tax=Streptomyces coryli TaxID=1128680 RepID=A0A6G4U4I0_9ACTN|nr:LCP family protein [Streptomyces coryli]